MFDIDDAGDGAPIFVTFAAEPAIIASRDLLLLALLGSDGGGDVCDCGLWCVCDDDDAVTSL